MADIVEEPIPGCCGVKTMQLSRGQDGNITCTASGLKDDVILATEFVIKKFSSKYEYISWREQGHIYTTTVVTRGDSQISRKIKKDGSFKTIPEDFYRLYTSGMIYKSILDPLQQPDTDIYIKESIDIYGSEGWTVREIFSELRVNVSFPAILNYHVYEFRVQRGTPIINVVRSLFPIPGLMVEWYHNRIYVMLPPKNFPISWYPTGFCDLEGEQNQVQYYSHTVTGAASEPLYVDPDQIKLGSVKCSNRLGWSDLQKGGTFVELQFTYNLVGGIFSIDYEKTPAYDKQDQFDAMFVTGVPVPNP